MLFQQKPLKRFMPTMTNNLFKKAACFTDIHWGLKNNAKQHNEDCLDFIDWFIDGLFGTLIRLFIDWWINWWINCMIS